MLVNIHAAKTQFSKYINQVLNGEEIIIARGGKPLVKLIPYNDDTEVRRGGQFRGLMEIEDDFDAPLPEEILNIFNGNKTVE